MTLLTAVFAAVITTIIWYTNDKRSQLKLGTLEIGRASCRERV